MTRTSWDPRVTACCISPTGWSSIPRSRPSWRRTWRLPRPEARRPKAGSPRRVRLRPTGLDLGQDLAGRLVLGPDPEVGPNLLDHLVPGVRNVQQGHRDVEVDF